MEIKVIGNVETEFSEKFGVPKQPGLVPSLRGKIVLNDAAYSDSLRGLEDCTHLWVLFWFHHNKAHQHATVRPPVLGGTKRMGIFATRSPHRPSPIGLSLVRIEKVEFGANPCVHISGHDLVSGTPVIDLKPYIESYDRPREQSRHWSEQVAQPSLAVCWQSAAFAELQALGGAHLRDTISAVLAQDPRPRSSKAGDEFGMSFAGVNIRFQSTGPEELAVLSVGRAEAKS